MQARRRAQVRQSRRELTFRENQISTLQILDRLRIIDEPTDLRVVTAKRARALEERQRRRCLQAIERGGFDEGRIEAGLRGVYQIIGASISPDGKASRGCASNQRARRSNRSNATHTTAGRRGFGRHTKIRSGSTQKVKFLTKHQGQERTMLRT